jgi:oligoribonuclease
MDKWCTDHHGKSGLTKAVESSIISLEHAYSETFAFIKQHCPERTGILAGNSVWQDRNFLVRYMPDIVNYLHYRIVDVTTIKVLLSHWYKDNKNIEYKKKDTHRALYDVYESIAELRHYQKYFFTPL